MAIGLFFRVAGISGLLAGAAGLGAALPSLHAPAQPERAEVAPAKPEPVTIAAAARPMPVCGSGRRVNCVVDGDTIWVAGEKIRIVGYNSPEVEGACRRERDLAAKATRRLSRMLSSERFSVERQGHDRYGRRLAVIRTGKGDITDTMVKEGLAHVWRGRKEDWCS